MATPPTGTPTTLNYVGTEEPASDTVADNATISGLIATEGLQSASAVSAILNSPQGFQGYETDAALQQQLTPAGEAPSDIATKAQTDAAYANLVPVASIGTVGGPAQLNASGRLTPAQIPTTITVPVQRLGQMFLSPSAYNTANVSASGTTSAEVYTFTLPDPGWAYQPMISGDINVYGSAESCQVQVLSGNPAPGTGQLLAQATSMPNWPLTWGIDSFNRPVGGDLGGPGYWEQFQYTVQGSAFVQNNNGGQYEITAANQAGWLRMPNGALVETLNANVRTYASDAVTASDFQRIRLTISLPTPSNLPGSGDSPPRLIAIGRLANDQSSCVVLEVTGAGYVFGGSGGTVAPPQAVGYYVGTGGLPEIGNAPTPLASATTFSKMSANDVFDFWFGYSGNVNEYVIQQNGTTIWSATASGPVIGSSNRGWGWGGLATVPEGWDVSGQFYPPPALSAAQIMDPQVPFTAGDYANTTSTNHVSQTLWINSGHINAVPILTGSVTCYVVLIPGQGLAGGSQTVTATDDFAALQVALLPATVGVSNEG